MLSLFKCKPMKKLNHACVCVCVRACLQSLFVACLARADPHNAPSVPLMHRLSSITAPWIGEVLTKVLILVISFSICPLFRPWNM